MNRRAMKGTALMMETQIEVKPKGGKAKQRGDPGDSDSDSAMSETSSSGDNENGGGAGSKTTTTLMAKRMRGKPGGSSCGSQNQTPN